MWLVVSGWPPKYSGKAVRVISDQARKFRWQQVFGLDQSPHGTVVMLFGPVRVCVGERLPDFDFAQTAVVAFDLDTHLIEGNLSIDPPLLAPRPLRKIRNVMRMRKELHTEIQK